VLETIALGGPAAAGHALERGLDLAEPNGTVMVFLLHPPRACYSVMPGSAPPTPPRPAGILSLPAGQALGRPPGRGRCWRR
jgi:hypothetical protein